MNNKRKLSKIDKNILKNINKEKHGVKNLVNAIGFLEH